MMILMRYLNASRLVWSWILPNRASDSILSRITGAARYLELENPNMRRRPDDTGKE
jgi:hypothetical protein